MSWQMKVTRFVDNDAEIVVHVDYFDSDEPDLTLHHEEPVYPAGTSEAEIENDLAHLGRSARQKLGRARPKASILNRVIGIDDKGD